MITLGFLALSICGFSQNGLTDLRLVIFPMDTVLITQEMLDTLENPMAIHNNLRYEVRFNHNSSDSIEVVNIKLGTAVNDSLYYSSQLTKDSENLSTELSNDGSLLFYIDLGNYAFYPDVICKVYLAYSDNSISDLFTIRLLDN